MNAYLDRYVPEGGVDVTFYPRGAKYNLYLFYFSIFSGVLNIFSGVLNIIVGRPWWFVGFGLALLMVWLAYRCWKDYYRPRVRDVRRFVGGFNV